MFPHALVENARALMSGCLRKKERRFSEDVGEKV
jgi:hypothetical protein